MISACRYHSSPLVFQDVTEEEKIERDRILVDTVTKYVSQLNEKL